jgi:hypothetical protein
MDLEKRDSFHFAKENGLWINDFYDLGNPLGGGGNENTLALDNESKYTYKSNNLFNSNNSVLQLLEQVESHNKLFPETKYELVGFTGFDNGENKTPYVEPIIKQCFISNAEQATQNEISTFMQSIGFEKINDTTFKNKEYTVSDLHPRNVLKDENGTIYVVDDIIKKNKEHSMENSISNQKNTEARMLKMGKERLRQREEMSKQPSSWEKIDQQIAESFHLHGQKNPNKKMHPRNG